MQCSKIYKAKQCSLFMSTLFIYIISFSLFATTVEIQPFSLLGKSKSGMQLLEIEKTYKHDPKQALEHLNQLKKLDTWDNSPTLSAKYYLLEIKIQKALSAPNLANDLIKKLNKYANHTGLNWLILESNYQRQILT